MLHNLFHTEHVYQICFSLCFSRIPLQLIFTPFFWARFLGGHRDPRTADGGPETLEILSPAATTNLWIFGGPEIGTHRRSGKDTMQGTNISPSKACLSR